MKKNLDADTKAANNRRHKREHDARQRAAGKKLWQAWVYPEERAALIEWLADLRKG